MTASDLLAAGGPPDPIFPGTTLRALERSGDVLRGVLVVDAACPLFAGHFPGRPVLPAVGQLALIAALCQRGLGISAAPTGIERAKFITEVRPGAALSFELRLDAGRGRVRWTLTRGAVTVATGDLRLAAAPG